LPIALAPSPMIAVRKRPARTIALLGSITPSSRSRRQRERPPDTEPNPGRAAHNRTSPRSDPRPPVSVPDDWVRACYEVGKYRQKRSRRAIGHDPAAKRHHKRAAGN
jgi:hypothetical protein